MAANRLHIRVKSSVQGKIRSGHPWVYAEAILEQNRPGLFGEMAVIFDRKDKFLGLGLYDPESPIRVRLLHVGKPLQITDTWWKERIQAAVEKRKALFGPETNGYRVVNGENDGFPGLILDRYADCLVLKLYTSWWLAMLPGLKQWILEAIPASQMVLRLSRNVQASAKKQFNLEDGTMLHGPSPADPLLFQENGLLFEADVLHGQKTGFFLDQRDNRQHVGQLSAGRVVINAFSFTGGFSVYAASGGARSVTDIDISKHALEGAARNFKHNGLEGRNHTAIQANVFDWLEAQTKPCCDLLVIDPPSLAKREQEKEGAINAYNKLAARGAKILRKGGILVAASCSAHVAAEAFFETILQSAQNSGRPFHEMQRRHHPADHPATFMEANYLKCIFLAFD
ncbi:MAG: class I SAM-dependent methyltransferase [Verrucomicrobiales bacterium]